MDELITALTETGLPFAHFAWSKAPDGDYGTYSERGAGSVWAAGHMAEQTSVCVVDYYTRDDTGGVKQTIQSALNSIEVSWYLDLVDFGDDGYIHYVWVVEFPEESEADSQDLTSSEEAVTDG